MGFDKIVVLLCGRFSWRIYISYRGKMVETEVSSTTIHFEAFRIIPAIPFERAIPTNHPTYNVSTTSDLD